MTYCVHASADEIARPHRVEAKSFTDAALTYAERWLQPDGWEEAVTLYVQDEATGEEHCLRVDLRDGEVQPCG